MNKYDGSGYTGAGYHDSSQDDLVILSHAKKTQDDNIAALRQTWQPSDHEYVSDNLVQMAQQWNQYNRVLIKSWDLANNYGVGGSVARLENTQTRARSTDFKFTIQQKGFYKLKPNMNVLREEVDAGLISFAWSDVGDITRYSGVTATGDCQIIVSKIKDEFCFGWISFGDQKFIALTNKWRLTKNSNSSWDIGQSTNTVFDIRGAIEYQRSIL
jgi:hypothetical protein